MSVTTDVLIETDSRGRTNLSKFSKNDRFLARQEDDGTIVLEPARIVSAAEDRLRRNPRTMQVMEEAESAIDNAIELHVCDKA
ncbi:hypothetical protein A5664_02550 [Mycolicibacterium fortuitum]|uniref:hypothetical protein n=1 Tax=Mycolicibacterium fortuitum TaxID=1766 RepID=UPI0007ECCF83|nr:hypothetical protein [Mycolicibacterium fortuitum]OBI77121.1 hypothetical protein A5664_02550 [Mycolicibacterium fortuitum]